MNVGDKVKVIKLHDGWEEEFMDFEEQAMIVYRLCVGKTGTVKWIDDGKGFVDGRDELELEIDGKSDLYFYRDELELVEEV